MIERNLISKNEVLLHLNYHRDDGVFTWRAAKGNRPAGSRAGGVASTGYVHVRINKKTYKEHRLVWLVEHGYLPDLDIDHIDRNKSNNKIHNLRLATRQKNMLNTEKPKSNTSGYKGVGYDKKEGKWRAYIRVNYKSVFLGYSETPEGAYKLRQVAEEKILCTGGFGGGDGNTTLPA